MKNLRFTLVLSVMALFASYRSFAQVEQGDFNISAAFTFNSTVGSGNDSGNWTLFNSAGYYITDNIEAGVTLLLFGTTGDNSTTTPGYGLFGSYSFLTNNANLVPFAGLQFFVLNIEGFDAFTSVGINGGAKYFINENLFINNRLDYGFLISPSTAEGGQITLSIGLGFIF